MEAIPRTRNETQQDEQDLLRRAPGCNFSGVNIGKSFGSHPPSERPTVVECTVCHRRKTQANTSQAVRAREMCTDHESCYCTLEYQWPLPLHPPSKFTQTFIAQVWLLYLQETREYEEDETNLDIFRGSSTTTGWHLAWLLRQRSPAQINHMTRGGAD